jgi:hypothetical protein
MRPNIQLVLFTTEPDQVSALKERFGSDRNISVALGNGPEITNRFKLDALWMAPMQAHYFGIDRVIPPHIAEVFDMPIAKREKGLPRLLIAGGSLVPGKSYSPRYLAQICAISLANAIQKYNDSHDRPILRVGSNPGNLGLDDPKAADAFQAVKQAFAQAGDPEVESRFQKTNQFA